MQSNIYAQVRQEADNFFDNEVEVVPGYTFNQYETIKKCHLYSASRFVNNEPYCGRNKVFYNIVNAPCEVATKFLNFDTKDVRIKPINAKSEFGTFLLQKEMELWLKENNLDFKLNKIAEEAPKYGSVVVKKTKEGVDIVDLRKFIIDPSVDEIKKSPFIIQQHYYTGSELREKGKNSGWNTEAIEEAIENFKTVEPKESYIDDQGKTNKVVSPYIKVWERFGEVPEKWLDGDMTPVLPGDKFVKSYFVIAGAYNEQTNDKGDTYYEDGVCLFKGKWSKDYPYYDFHYRKLKGRWLGVGVIEDLFTPQERINELANQKRIAMELSTKHIFQTSDDTVLRSLLNDVDNGTIIKTSPQGGIQPVVNEERNLAAFGSEEARWGQIAQNLSFSFDAVRGESLPSSTPATNAVIQDRNASSVFVWKRERLGVMLQDLFTKEVLPQLVKDLDNEHVMMFSGSNDEFMKLDKIVTEHLARNKAMEKLLSGKAVSGEEYAEMKENVSKKLKGFGNKRWVKIKKGLYKDLDIQMDVMLTNEQENVDLVTQNLFSVIGALSQNPQLLENPLQRALFTQYLEKIGISPAEIQLAEEQESEVKQLAGSGQPDALQALAQQMPQGRQPQGGQPQGMQPPQQ